MYPGRTGGHFQECSGEISRLEQSNDGYWIVGLVAQWLACQGCPPQQGVSSSQRDVTYTVAGRDKKITSWEPELAADIVLLIDQSGSMSTGREPTDPTGLRVKGSLAFLEFVAGRSRPDLTNRLGVVNFGSTAPREHTLPLTAIASGEDQAFARTSAQLVPLDLGDTSFISAMQRAVQLLHEGGSFAEHRNRALVIFTDPVEHLSASDRIVVYEPEPGRWRYEVVGGAGAIEVLRNSIPLRMRLISPSPVHPQGKPMRLVAEFKRTDGKPVKPYRDYPLGLTAEVKTPAGNSIPVKFPLGQDRKEVLSGEPTIEETMTLGEYLITLKVSGGGKYQNRHPVTVHVQPVPYLEIQQPSENMPIIPYTDGAFEGMVPLPEPEEREPQPAEGAYTVVVQLAPEGETEAVAADYTAAEFTLRYPPRPVWVRYSVGIYRAAKLSPSRWEWSNDSALCLPASHSRTQRTAVSAAWGNGRKCWDRAGL